MGLSPDVRFMGNQDDVPAWYACADIAVLPSFGDEGVPQSLMQAAACGLPAISTPIGAIAEAVRDGKTGLLVPPLDRRCPFFPPAPLNEATRAQPRAHTSSCAVLKRCHKTSLWARGTSAA